MKLLKIEVSLSDRGFKKTVIEYEMEEKEKAYIRKIYPRRILKKDLLVITSDYGNRLPTYSIGFETMCLPVNEDQAVTLLKKAIVKRIGELKDSLDKLLSGMDKIDES